MMMTSELPISPFLTLHKIKYPRLGENIYCKNDLTSILLRTKKEGDRCLQLSFVNYNSITEKQWRVARSAWKNVFYQKTLNPGT